MNNGIGEFKGSTRQAINDINSRLDRIESKLDNMIDKNIVISALTSIVVAVVSVIGFGGFKR